MKALYLALKLHWPTTTQLIHLHQNEISSHLSHTVSRFTLKSRRKHTHMHTLTDLCMQKRFQGSRDRQLSLCQVPQIDCSLHHSYFCLFTLCSRLSCSVTSPYYLYVHFSASIIIIIAFRMFVPRLEERQCFHC